MNLPLSERAIQALQLTQDEINALDRTEQDTFAYSDAQVARAQVVKVLRLLTIEPTDFADYVVSTLPNGIQGFIREWGFDQYTAAMLSVVSRMTPTPLETDLSRRLDCLPPATVMAWGLMRYAHEIAATDSDRYLRQLTKRGASALGFEGEAASLLSQSMIFEKLLAAAKQWTEHQKAEAARAKEAQARNDLAATQAQVVADEIAEFADTVVPMHKPASGIMAPFTYRRLVGIMVDEIMQATYEDDRKHFPPSEDLRGYMLAELHHMLQSQHIVFDEEGTMDHISMGLTACVQSKATPHENLDRTAIRKVRGRADSESVNYIDNHIWKTMSITTDWR